MARQGRERRSEFARRTERLARKVGKRKLDALIVCTDVNRLYLTGFASTAGYLVVQPGEEPQFFTDFRYLEMARGAVDFGQVKPLNDFSRQFSLLARKKGWKRVGYEGEIPSTRLDAMRQAMPDIAEWEEAQETIREMRAVKSRGEQAAIRRAVHLTDEAWRRTLEEVTPGMTERDIRRGLRGWMDALDADEEAFPCIVSVGSNSSRPHAHVTRRILRRGQPLLIDMGARVDRYCSDMTRTVFFGKPSGKMREIYDVVLEAQQKALSTVREGLTGAEIDATAREVIAGRGYGERFGHGLGHGVGLEIHEAPSVSKTNNKPLRAGMVVTIEPGVYLPGTGGVRIEDTVVVRKNGCEIFTQSPKELIVL